MSAAPRLPVIFSTLAAASAVGALSLSSSLRSILIPSRLRALVPASVSSYLLKLLAAVIVLINAKNIPTTWHFRVLRAIFTQIHLGPKAIDRKHLFTPIVTTSWNSPLDCDYNLHKSNSTYFKDLDVARAHYVGALIRTGLRRLQAGDREGLPVPPRRTSDAGKAGKKPDTEISNSYIIALGAVACSFRKEIKPLEKFEIWTRILAWDSKWIYIVSHVVKAGAVRPQGHHLQSGRSSIYSAIFGGRSTSGVDAKPLTPEETRRSVYATSIAKYVCKKGRMSIPPEIILERSRLLPTVPRPAHMPSLRGGFTTPTEATSGLVNGTSDSASSVTTRSEADLLVVDRNASPGSGVDTPLSGAGLSSPEAIGAALGRSADEPGLESAGEIDELTWDDVEAIRLRGLKYASQFDALAGLHDEFDYDGDCLGVWGDWIY